MERFLSPPVPWRPAHAIHYAHRYGRAARRCDDPADHAHPDDRRPHHAHLHQQGRSERLPWPLALPEILSGGPSYTGRLRHGGGPCHHAGGGNTWRRSSGRVQVVGGYLVCLSDAHGQCAANHPVHFRGRVRLAGLPLAATSAAGRDQGVGAVGGDLGAVAPAAALGRPQLSRCKRLFGTPRLHFRDGGALLHLHLVLRRLKRQRTGRCGLPREHQPILRHLLGAASSVDNKPICAEPRERCPDNGPGGRRVQALQAFCARERSRAFRPSQTGWHVARLGALREVSRFLRPNGVPPDERGTSSQRKVQMSSGMTTPEKGVVLMKTKGSRLWKWAKRVLVGVGGLVIVLLIAGVVYQFVTTKIDDRRYPALG